jgi:hypothetical protein
MANVLSVTAAPRRSPYEASPTLVWGLTVVAIMAMGVLSSALTAESSPAAGGAARAERPDAIQTRP